MLNQKYIPFQEYKSSTEKDEYQYLFKKDDDLKRNGKEDCIEQVIHFKFCKIFSDEISN